MTGEPPGAWGPPGAGKPAGAGGPKRRHGCLTAWLGVLIAFHVLAAVANTARTGLGRMPLAGAARWPFPALTALALANILFAIALFRWKKWGFYGFCVTAAAAVLLNLRIGLPLAPALSGLLGVGVLYAVLQIGGARRAWSQLE